MAEHSNHLVKVLDDPQQQHSDLYTVGHSNQSSDEFVRLLNGVGIDVLVDVRSHPYSRYASHFSAPDLKKTITAAGIRYLYLGRDLGGRPDGQQYYDAEGHVRYDRVAQSDIFRSGIHRLKVGLQRFRVAIMCSEEDPSNCHRRLLVGRVLANEGVNVLHLRSGGRVQSETELADALYVAEQLPLFDEQEPLPWKSTRSVLQRKVPPSSSERLDEQGLAD